MTNESPVPSVSKPARIAGYILSYLPAAALLLGSVIGIISSQKTQADFALMGYPASTGRPIGVVLLISTVLYIVPRTSVLGAILLTGYLGGAVATHVRMEDGMFFPAVIFGILLWLGLLLREPRLRALLPLRKSG